MIRAGGIRFSLLCMLALVAYGSGCGSSNNDASTTIDAFVGDWTKHGVTLTIDKSGYGTLSWRTYRTCGEDPPPCDTIRPGHIEVGGRGSLKLEADSQIRAHGQIITTTVPETFPTGPVFVRLDGKSDLLFLDPSPNKSFPFCGPEAAPAACG